MPNETLIKTEMKPDGTKADYTCLDGAGEIPPNLARATLELIAIHAANGDLDWIMDMVNDAR